MFNSKQRQIETHQQWRKEIEPYIPIAEGIKQKIAAEIEEVDTADIEGVFERAVQEATQEERRKQFAELFQALPAEDRFRLILGQFNDEETKAAIAVERTEMVNRNLRHGYIAGLAERGREEGWIDVGDMPEGMSMRLWLYDKEAYDESDTAAELTDDYDVERFMRVISMGEGQFKVIEDSSPESYNDRIPQLKTFQIVRLGSNVMTDTAATLMPRIYFGSKLQCGIDGSVKTLKTRDSFKIDLVVGLVEVNGTVVLGDKYEES